MGKAENRIGAVPRTVFLDRDGVLNRKMPEGRYVTRWEELELLPGVPQAIARLNAAGARVIVVSNQRGVALGLYTAADVEQIHRRLAEELARAEARIDAFFFCPHDKHQCQCRKPAPGLFEAARRQFPEIEAASSVMIGDSASDIEFGRRLGMRTVFVLGEAENRKPGWEQAASLADAQAENLPEAVVILIGADGPV